MTITINQAFEQGRAAVQGAHNPYSQREGEPWHVENQDEMYDAWRRGYYSALHAEPCRCDGCQKYSPSGKEVLIHAIRHIRRTHMNTQAWTLTTADEQAIEILNDSLTKTEFDRINHRPRLQERA